MSRVARADPARDDLIAEVLDYLVGLRPLLRRDNEIDVTTTEAIERVVGDAMRINVQLTKPIAPCHGGCLLLECAHSLPALQTRIADGYRRIF